MVQIKIVLPTRLKNIFAKCAANREMIQTKKTHANKKTMLKALTTTL